MVGIRLEEEVVVIETFENEIGRKIEDDPTDLRGEVGLRVDDELMEVDRLSLEWREESKERVEVEVEELKLRKLIRDKVRFEIIHLNSCY